IYTQPIHHPPLLHSFPTRRSSDLPAASELHREPTAATARAAEQPVGVPARVHVGAVPRVDFPTSACVAVLHVHAGCANAECDIRSEEHTSELQSRGHLVCRLLLEK